MHAHETAKNETLSKGITDKTEVATVAGLQ